MLLQAKYGYSLQSAVEGTGLGGSSLLPSSATNTRQLTAAANSRQLAAAANTRQLAAAANTRQLASAANTRPLAAAANSRLPAAAQQTPASQLASQQPKSEDDDNEPEGEEEERLSLVAYQRPHRHNLLLPLGRPGGQSTADDADRRTPTIEEEDDPELERFL